MDIGAFFRFPGILITIGIVLLIISIVIIILAIRSDKKADFKINEELKEDEDHFSFSDTTPEESNDVANEITPEEVTVNEVTEIDTSEEVNVPTSIVDNSNTSEVVETESEEKNEAFDKGTVTEEQNDTDEDIELL